MILLSILMILGLLIAVGLGVFHALKLNVEQEELLPYRAKKYFFSRSEQEFLRSLNESIDRQEYTVFPKVRLADFIEVTATGIEYQGALNRIKSKHVDFVIWNVLEGKIAIVIELDGKSHQSEKMIARDAFVEKLYKQIGIKLIRVSVGTNFVNEIEKLKVSLV
jgi:very-short-patch-repair endonuclease